MAHGTDTCTEVGLAEWLAAFGARIPDPRIVAAALPEAASSIVEIAGGRCKIAERQVAYERGALLARYDALEIPARDFIRKVFFGGCGTRTATLCVLTMPTAPTRKRQTDKGI